LEDSRTWRLGFGGFEDLEEVKGLGVEDSRTEGTWLWRIRGLGVSEGTWLGWIRGHCTAFLKAPIK